MVNVAIPWLKAKGFKWREIPSAARIENIAALLAQQPTPAARAQMIKRLGKHHPANTVDAIVDLGRDIYEKRRQARKSKPIRRRPVALHARRATR